MRRGEDNLRFVEFCIMRHKIVLRQGMHSMSVDSGIVSVSVRRTGMITVKSFHPATCFRMVRILRGFESTIIWSTMLQDESSLSATRTKDAEDPKSAVKCGPLPVLIQMRQFVLSHHRTSSTHFPATLLDPATSLAALSSALPSSIPSSIASRSSKSSSRPSVFRSIRSSNS